METPEFVVLRTFRSLFEGTRYKHRNSSLGDFVASQFYEDLVTLNKSASLVRRIQAHECVVNLANKTVGKPSRRGDGTFGELVPTVVAITEKGLHVARGEIANIQIGAETKILAKAMIKQIDRVIGDLIRQIDEFFFLRFRAANIPPYPFEWLDYTSIAKQYAALLLRLSRLYDQRFGV
jgi:hypothetical protein